MADIFWGLICKRQLLFSNLQIKMKIKFLFILTLIFITIGCNKSDTNPTSQKAQDVNETIDTTVVNEERVVDNDKPKKDFIPKGYVVYSEFFGDLNKDGVDDCVLIIKDTKPENIVTNRFETEVDRNRRGIVVLCKKGKGYELAVKNYNCFSSENEDGGVYFPPDLDIHIEKGNLILHYAHGRYGYWAYTFRHQNNDLELIGFDYSENFGPITQSFTSINFLTKKMLVKTNINPQEGLDEEVFESKWSKIEVDKLIKLSEIEDFDELVIEE